MDRFNELEQSWERRRRKSQMILGTAALIGAALFGFYKWSQSIEVSPKPYVTPAAEEKPLAQNPQPVQKTEPLPVETKAEPIPEPTPLPRPDIPAVQMELKLDRSFEAGIKEEIARETARLESAPSAAKPQEPAVEEHNAITSEAVQPEEKGSLLIENYHLDESYENGLKVARFFFETGEYQKAIEWALKANKLDSADDESWLIFANASIRAGEKEQAINALQTYLQKRDSIRVRQLYNQLKEE